MGIQGNTVTVRQRFETRLRAGGYLSVSLLKGAAVTFVPPLLLATLGSTAMVGLGFVLLPLALTRLRWFTDGERRRVGAFLETPIPPRYRPLPPGVAARLRQVLRDPVTKRDLGWVFSQIIIGIPAGMIGLFALLSPLVTILQMALWWVVPREHPLTMVGVPVTSWETALASGAIQIAFSLALLWWVVPVLARAQAWLAMKLLAPSKAQQLRDRVDTLAQTRAGALAAHTAELRRIERDLHDGAQAQLVSLAMRLGVAERALADDPATAARLLQEARYGTEEAMAELRDVARTIYPPILTDRGLSGAVSALGARCPVPTQITVEELSELPGAVEAAAYFVIAEALNNVAKHSGAENARVRLWRDRGSLHVEIVDDGVGGIDETRGSGVIGIRRRVAALDGTTTLASPPGGPTSIMVELPCGS